MHKGLPMPCAVSVLCLRPVSPVSYKETEVLNYGTRVWVYSYALWLSWKNILYIVSYEKRMAFFICRVSLQDAIISIFKRSLLPETQISTKKTSLSSKA